MNARIALLEEIKACLAFIEIAEKKVEAQKTQSVPRREISITLALIFILCGMKAVSNVWNIKNTLEHLRTTKSESDVLSFIESLAYLGVLPLLINRLYCALTVPSKKMTLPMTSFSLSNDTERARLVALQEQLGLVVTSRLAVAKEELIAEKIKLSRELLLLQGVNENNQGSALFNFFAKGEGAAIEVVTDHVLPYLRNS